MHNQPLERLTITVAETATLLSCSKFLIYEGIKRGQIPHLTIGSKILIPKARLVEMVNNGNGNGRATSARASAAPEGGLAK